MTAQLLKLGGSQVKQPKTFTISSYNLTKSGRTANGKMYMDLIAKKRKFALQYDVIGGNDLTAILTVIDSDAMFFTIDYFDNGVSKTATVYVGDISKTQFRTDGGWYWKDVKFDLIEQ